jgi:ABC-type glycerol-3-phosphate transport system substrate-binding protein
MDARTLSATLVTLAMLACGDAEPRLTFSGSAVGAEGELIRRQLARFADLHPERRVEVRITPDAADQRHQLYVQWLNAHAPEPDVLQLDVIWTPEFAAAGWVAPLDPLADEDDFFPALLAANRWQERLYAVPWFVDVGLLYWRTDLFDTPPASLPELRTAALDAVRAGRVRDGLLWQGARYEGLVTVFLEHAAAFGGGVLDQHGEVIVDRPEAIRALTFMRDSIQVDGFVPASVLTSQEEHTRFAFQSGQAAFMRNWPYAWAPLRHSQSSRVADRVGVIPFPAAPGGRRSAALGGAQLAINRYSEEPDRAAALIAFLTAPEQMLERAEVAGQLPARRSLFESSKLAQALSMPLREVRQAVEAAVPRPVTPVYTELSERLQVHLHRSLSRQEEPDAALRAAATEIRALLARTGLEHQRP